MLASAGDGTFILSPCSQWTALNDSLTKSYVPFAYFSIPSLQMAMFCSGYFPLAPLQLRRLVNHPLTRYTSEKAGEQGWCCGQYIEVSSVSTQPILCVSDSIPVVQWSCTMRNLWCSLVAMRRFLAHGWHSENSSHLERDWWWAQFLCFDLRWGCGMSVELIYLWLCLGFYTQLSIVRSLYQTNHRAHKLCTGRSLGPFG